MQPPALHPPPATEAAPTPPFSVKELTRCSILAAPRAPNSCACDVRRTGASPARRTCRPPWRRPRSRTRRPHATRWRLADSIMRRSCGPLRSRSRASGFPTVVAAAPKALAKPRWTRLMMTSRPTGLVASSTPKATLCTTARPAASRMRIIARPRARARTNWLGAVVRAPMLLPARVRVVVALQPRLRPTHGGPSTTHYLLPRAAHRRSSLWPPIAQICEGCERPFMDAIGTIGGGALEWMLLQTTKTCVCRDMPLVRMLLAHNSTMPDGEP